MRYSDSIIRCLDIVIGDQGIRVGFLDLVTDSWTDGRTNEQASGRVDGLAGGQADWRTGGRADERMDESEQNKP